MSKATAKTPAKTRRGFTPNEAEAVAAAAAIRAAVLKDLESDPAAHVPTLAAKHGISTATVWRYRAAARARAVEAPTAGPNANPQTNEAEDSVVKWARLLRRHVPLRMRAKALEEMIKSGNPVSVGRALEIVLDSDGLRKKLPQSNTAASIVVAAADDLGFD